MRVGTVSALCALFSLNFTPGRAAAQTSPGTHPVQQTSPEKMASIAKAQEAVKSAEAENVQHGINSAKEPASEEQWIKVIRLQQQNRPGTVAILPPGESANCAHIVVFQAPETDSEMVVEVPSGTGGNITTFKGLQPCARDFRFALRAQQLPGLFFRRRGPFFQRPFEPLPSGQPASDKPKENEGPAAKP